jgi:hypothetical protein
VSSDQGEHPQAFGLTRDVQSHGGSDHKQGHQERLDITGPNVPPISSEPVPRTPLAERVRERIREAESDAKSRPGEDR